MDPRLLHQCRQSGCGVRQALHKKKKIGIQTTTFRLQNDTTDILISQPLEIELYTTETVACHLNRCMFSLWARLRPILNGVQAISYVNPSLRHLQT